MLTVSRLLAGALGSIVGASAFAVAAATLEDFARLPLVREVSMSPDGEHIAVVAPFDDQQSLHLFALSKPDARRVLRFRPGRMVHDVLWVDDDRVVFQKLVQSGSLEMPRLSGEVYSANLNSKRQRRILGVFASSKDGGGFGHADLLGAIDAEPGSFLATFYPWNSGEDTNTELWRVNARTGRTRLIATLPAAGGRVFADHALRPRLIHGMDENLEPIVKYRGIEPDATWRPLPQSLVGHSITPQFFSADDRVLYALISDLGEPAALYRVDLAKAERVRLAGRERSAIAQVFRAGRDGAPYAVLYDAAQPEIEWIADGDEDWTAMQKALLEQFPGALVRPQQISRDGKRVLLRIESDRLAPSWYVFDRGTQKLRFVADAYPALRDAQMARTQTVEFKTRDVLTLAAFLTMPNGLGKHAPLVVMPHGGPHGPYDTWSFNADTQLLANAGYAVLRVNFRGSGGRGDRFLKAGFKEWGGTIQDDIADAVKHVVAGGQVDGERICSFGGSFGGYAALMNPIRHRDLYRCAIGYAGVYDLNLLHREGDIPGRASGRRYLKQAIGTDAAALKLASPADQVDALDVPLLLIHGGADQRVPIEQFRALTSALDRAKKPYRELVVESEGHGFYKYENRVAMFTKIVAFLDEHIGSRAASKPSRNE